MAKHAASSSGSFLPQGGVRMPLWLSGRRAVALAAGILACVLLVLALAWQLLTGSGAAGLEPDYNARQGTLHAASVEVPEGGFQLVLNQTPTATQGSPSLNVEFENPAANAYAGSLTLTLEDGRVLGQTEVVQPGWYVENLKMRETLEPGAYPAQAEVTLLQDDREVSRSSAQVEVRVRQS